MPGLSVELESEDIVTMSCLTVTYQDAGRESGQVAKGTANKKENCPREGQEDPKGEQKEKVHSH